MITFFNSGKKNQIWFFKDLKIKIITAERQTQETRTKSVINSTKSPTDNQPQDINFQTP